MLPSNQTCQETSLDAVILNATNPLVKHEDPSAVQAVVQAVCRDPSAAAAAVRILAHKIHSPQQREAMKALSVVQACIINCGPAFHSEIGKFRFLNEMIKLVSPKFAGQVTAAEIKSRVLELLYCWSRDLTDEPKIAEAYNMLKKQGIVKTDPAYIGPLFASTPAPRTPTSTIEDSERSELLQRLLQSKRPEDLDRANALIQAMVRDDQRRVERTNNTLMELEMARNNVKVLDEMLSEHEQRACDPTHVSLMTELHGTCTRLRNSLYQTIAQGSEATDDHMSALIAVNEDLTRVMGRYRLLVEVAPPAAGGVGPAEGPEGGDALLDLSSPQRRPPTPPGGSAVTADLVQQQLDRFGLADTPPTSTGTPPTPAASCSAVSLLQDLDSSSLASPHTAPSGVTMGDLSPAEGGLVPPLIPLSAPQSEPPQSTPALPPPPVVDPLSELSSDWLQSALPPNAPPMGRHFAPPSKISMNQLKLIKAGASKPAPCSSSGGPVPACAPPAAGCRVLQEEDLGGGGGSAPPAGDSEGVHVPNGDMNPSGDVDPKQDVAPQQDGNPSGDVDPLGGEVLSGGEGSKRPSMERAQFVEVKPLCDVTVSMDAIIPAPRAPARLLQTEALTVELHHTRNSPRPDITVYVLTTTSRSPAPLTHYLAQACVPRACRVRLLPPSATHLPQYSPFLPPPAITQVLLVANPNEVNVSLKLMLSYSLDGDTVTEMAEVENLDL